MSIHLGYIPGFMERKRLVPLKEFPTMRIASNKRGKLIDFEKKKGLIKINY
jgi:hypothetical protein